MEYLRYLLKGLNTDVPPAELPPDTWTGCTNMINRNGFMRRSNGNLQVGTYNDTATVLAFFYFKLNGANYYFSLTTAGQFYISGAGSSTPIISPWTLLKAYIAEDVSGGVINNCVAFNYQDQPPLYWEPTVALGVAKAWPVGQWPATSRAGVMRTWRNHIFVANVTQAGVNYPNMLAWSSAATLQAGIPTEWIATSTNDARSIFLGESAGPILDMIPLRDQLFVFFEGEFHSLSYIGGSFVFSARKVTDSFGINGKNCAVDCGGFLVCLCNEDVMWTDGQSFRSIATQRVRDAIVAMTTITSRRYCFVFFNQATKDVYVCLARANDTTCHVAWVWNVDTELWSFVELVDPGASGASGAIGLICANYVPLLGSTPTGQLTTNSADMMGSETRALTGNCSFIQVQGNSAWLAGGSVVGTLRRFGLDLGNPDAVKTVTRVDLNVTGPPNASVDISVTARMQETDPVSAPVWSSPQSGTYQFPVLVTGRFIDIEIRSSNVGWGCQGMSIVTGAGSVY